MDINKNTKTNLNGFDRVILSIQVHTLLLDSHIYTEFTTKNVRMFSDSDLQGYNCPYDIP